MLKAEHAHRSGIAEEETPCGRRQAEPAGRDHPDDVSAGECQHVAGAAVYPGDEAVGPHGDVCWRFALGTAVAIEFPAGPLLQHVAGQLSIEAPVLPLIQLVTDFRADTEAGQFARLRGAL